MSNEYQLDTKDRKILSELDVDARQSNSQIGKKVGLSKEVVKYRIDRLIENGIILRFHTVINYFKLGIVKFKLYLRLTNVNKEKLEEIGQYFYKHNKTEWVVTTTGRWDMIVGFLVHNVNEFDDEVQIVLNKFSNYIQDKAVTTTIYLAHHTREFLRSEPTKEISKIVYHTTKDKQEKIDNIDEEIIKILTNNARIPVTDMAKRLNTTPRIIQYHLKELERKKIILAYKVHLDPKAIGRIFCKSIIYLTNVTQNKLNIFINYASSLSGAIWPQRVMGNWDFELDFELESYDKFQDIILNLKEKFPDIIKNYEFCIVSKEFKLDLFPNCYREIN
ncbi:Lrp/AsnC family transcriptional regulator [Candidatus Woesearchaeota archaeon]|nr:Lrp/AsnC family transcriptional regulator [Candidatus Woesearchaeota archaeon]HLC59835.1 Lrp/AsnC family transcriptional regulator [Candidatus Nanoarchaeia archaeon]